MKTFDYCVYSKRGSSLFLDNQRGIAKSFAISKLRNKILFHRIKSVTESKLLGLQSGFRSGLSTMEQIMTLRFLLDAARTQKRSLTVVFVDYSKAFDSVDRRAIPLVLRHYGVPDPAIADVMQLYHGSTAAVSTRFGLRQKRSIPPVVFYKGIPCRLTSFSCWSTIFSDSHSSMKMDFR